MEVETEFASNPGCRRRYMRAPGSVTVIVLLPGPLAGVLDAERSANCFDPIAVVWRVRSWLSICAESCEMSDSRNCEVRSAACWHRMKKNRLHGWSAVCPVSEPVI